MAEPLILLQKESLAHEKRVALVPETIQTLCQKGLKVWVEKDAGKKAGFSDALYKNAGAEIVSSPDRSLADLIVQVSFSDPKEIEGSPSGTMLIGGMGQASPLWIETLAERGMTLFALERIPRLSRTQSMDVLSSQSNLAGYRAVIECAMAYGRCFPMMMTAAGTLSPARVLVLGAGVAGLQAIATARRLGAVVTGFDIRASVREHIESLGARFLSMDPSQGTEILSGYAQEVDHSLQEAHRKQLTQVLCHQDIVITTAQIPGKKAPLLITEEAIKGMKAGSVILDLAGDSGGNCSLAERGKTVNRHGVQIMSPLSILSGIAEEASRLFSRNLKGFLELILACPQETTEGFSPWILEDEILKHACLMHNGQRIHQEMS